MNKDTILSAAAIIGIISVIVFCGYQSCRYMRYIDSLVEQHRIELLGK